MLFSGALTISAGVNNFQTPKRVNTALIPGLKVVILLSGRLHIQIEDDAAHEICGPAAIVIKSSTAIRREQVFAPGIPIRYALVQMNDTISGENLVKELKDLAERGHRPRNSALLLTCPAGKMLQSLASQIMSCPIQGPERDLFLGGKALQLTALTIGNCLAAQRDRGIAQLTSRDVDNIQQARALLIASMQKPPGLETLAHQVGLNPHKLNRGFRQIYGTTVYGFLQEYRLEQAYRLLASGEMSVSQVAHHIGYGAAHFATIFRWRFGISPSQLRQ